MLLQARPPRGCRPGMTALADGCAPPLFVQVFVQQKVMRVAHMDANAIIQVYVEGPKPPKEAPKTDVMPKEAAGAAAEPSAASALAAAEAGPSGAAEDPEGPAKVAAAGGEGGEAAAGAADEQQEGQARPASPPPQRPPSPPRPTFDSVVVSVAVAEEWPENKLAAPLGLHFGLVPHQVAMGGQCLIGPRLTAARPCTHLRRR